MSALEQSFRDICEKHDLTVLSVSASRRTDGSSGFRATAHWDGFSRTGNACEFGYGDTIAEALAELFGAVTSARTPEGPTLADEPLPVEG